MNTKKRKYPLALALAMTTFFSVASASAETDRFTQATQTTTAPFGYVQFCRENPVDCTARAENEPVVVLSQSRWRELVQINDQVNQAVEPVTDEDNFGVEERWTYPVSGRGDCEDYVLQKRKTLIQRGWPAGSLLITVVRDEKGDGHAILLARTDKGDMVLDNQNPQILPWWRTPYQYVKRQSGTDARRWVSIEDRRVETVAGLKR